MMQKNKVKEHNRKAQSIETFSGVMVLYMFASLLTKLLGFGREIFITQRFGYGAISDGYILGFSVPDLVYSLLVGGAITASVTPILSSAIERDEEDRVWPPISTFFTLILIFFAGFMLVGEIFAPDLVAILNPGKSAEVIDIASGVSRAIFLQTLFFILIAIVSSVLSANKVFGLQVFGDTIYNLICLLSIFFLGSQSKSGAVRVAIGIVFASMCYFLYVFHFAKPYMTRFKPTLKLRDPMMKRIYFLAIPPIISSSVRQLTVIISQIYADQFVGAVTSLRNADTLSNLPFNIIVASVGPMMLPNISGFLARRAHKEASDYFSKAVRTGLYLMLPASIFFFICSTETVQAVFQWNVEKYPMSSVFATGSILKIYAILLIFQLAKFFIHETFYAGQKSWIALVTAVIQLLLSPLFFHLFLNQWGFGLEGLAWASMVINIIVLAVSYWLMRRFVTEIRVHDIGGFLVKSFASLVFASGFLNVARFLLPEAGSKLVQLIFYVILAMVMFGAYFLATIILDMPEAQNWLNLSKKLFGRLLPKKG
jgi:putative peptidoglycan lipid II flippase